MFQPTFQPRPRRHHRDLRRGPGPADMAAGFRQLFGRERLGRGPIRRGEIRPMILATLETKPMHGYEVIQSLEARSGGRWRPSAGSVYPTLQQLADEGLVTAEEIDGRRTYQLTDEGRAAAAANPAPRTWSDPASDGEADLPQLVRQLMEATAQVQHVGSAHARLETDRILADARREIYRVLADDEAQPAAGEGPEPS